MQQLLPLLKYLKRDSITPEALQEILGSFGVTSVLEQITPIANSFRERGPGGLLEHLPTLTKLWKSRQTSGAESREQNQNDDPEFVLLVECKNCHQIKRVVGHVSQLPLVH